jgi:molybdate transport system substrate-binding protein
MCRALVLTGLLGVLWSTGCGREAKPGPARLTVAAAANLTGVFDEAGRLFQQHTGTEVVFSFGSTVQLSQQIEYGAPFDLFASADTEHIDQLISSGKIEKESRAIYALGQLALWTPFDDTGVRGLKDLAKPKIRYIAVAQPELAPYGRATMEALQSAGLWDILRPKVVYANSINMAKQVASSGNADAAFTAYSLVMSEKGSVVKVDPKLHRPIQQALGVVTASQHRASAEKFRDFLLGVEGRALLERSGYLAPGGQP